MKAGSKINKNTNLQILEKNDLRTNIIFVWLIMNES